LFLLNLYLCIWQKNCINIYVFYFQIFNNGALPQNPLTFLSWNKKASKKINLVEAAAFNINQNKFDFVFAQTLLSRLCPLHSKNLRSKSWNRPNSCRRNTSELKQGRFIKAFLTFFGSPDKVNPKCLAYMCCFTDI